MLDQADRLAGSLLVAMPQLQDPNFRRTVVLLVAHGEDGAMGFIVNRHLPAGVKDVLDGLGIPWRGGEEEPLWGGGPVMPESGWVLFEKGSDPLPKETQEVLPGIFLTASIDALRALAQHPPPRLRLMLGYAGWGPGQLETELIDSSWLVVPADRRLLFETAAPDLWATAIRTLGIEPESIVPGYGVQ